MRAARNSHIFERDARMTEEEKLARRRKRYQIEYLNKLISLGASVTLDMGEDESIRLTSIAAHGRDKFLAYHWRGEAHDAVIVAYPLFSVSPCNQAFDQQIAHLNRLIGHNAAVSVDLVDVNGDDVYTRISHIERCAGQFKITHGAGEAKTIVGRNAFFNVRVG